MIPITEESIDYVFDANGQPKAAIVPIELWREMESELTTRQIQGNPKLRERLLTSLRSQTHFSWDEALKQAGILPSEIK